MCATLFLLLVVVLSLSPNSKTHYNNTFSLASNLSLCPNTFKFPATFSSSQTPNYNKGKREQEQRGIN